MNHVINVVNPFYHTVQLVLAKPYWFQFDDQIKSGQIRTMFVLITLLWSWQTAWHMVFFLTVIWYLTSFISLTVLQHMNDSCQYFIPFDSTIQVSQTKQERKDFVIFLLYCRDGLSYALRYCLSYTLPIFISKYKYLYY